MMLQFDDPKKIDATGVLFIRTLLSQAKNFTESTSDLYFPLVNAPLMVSSLIFRMFRRDNRKLIFLPFGMKCIFACKDDLIIMPDDSFRSIASVMRRRYFYGHYLKCLKQLLRFILTYAAIASLRRCTFLLVSMDDVESLKHRFPHHKFKYLPHPIQLKVLGRGAPEQTNLFPKQRYKICFPNIQEHYAAEPSGFFSAMSGNPSLSISEITFHGVSGHEWNAEFERLNCEIPSKYIRRVDCFASFIDEHDIVVMPLVAGAGIKNVALNSIYQNKIVLGTSEAFSGLPNALTANFVVNDFSEVASKVADIDHFFDDFNKLRSYVLLHHDLKNFWEVISNLRDL